MTYLISIFGARGSGKSSFLGTLIYGYFAGSYLHGEDCRKVVGSVGDSRGIKFRFWTVSAAFSTITNWISRSDGLVFMIDSVTFMEKLEDIRARLIDINANLISENDVGMPLLVIGNKQDLDGAISLDKMTELLKLDEIFTADVPYTIWSVIGINSKCSRDVPLALDLLHKKIVERRSHTHPKPIRKQNIIRKIFKSNKSE